MRLVYFSPVPWTSFAQRPHKFVEWFRKRTDGEILWIDPYPTRLLSLSDFMSVSQTHGEKAGVDSASSPRCLLPFALPIEPLPSFRWLNLIFWGRCIKEILEFINHEKCVIGIGKPSLLAVHILSMSRDSFSIYDAMDDFPQFYSGLSRSSMAQVENQVLKMVDKCWVSSHALQKKHTLYSDKMRLVNNACDAPGLKRVSITEKGQGRVVLGYIGTIGPWFDWSLVILIAKRLPECIIRLIGPLHSHAPEALPANIEIKQPCDHATALRKMAHFSVGLIPFKINALTNAVDPIKYYEYRSLGLPVLTTDFGEMSLRKNEPGIFAVNKETDFEALLRSLWEYEPSDHAHEVFVKENSWDVRFDSSGFLEEVPFGNS